MSNSCSVYYCGLSVVLLLLFFQASYAQSQQAYLEQRAKLVEVEYEMSLSGNPLLNSRELIANGILSQLLVKEAGVMGDYYPPSINFFQAHGWIDNTSILFPLVKNMPKGVIHHAHFDSSATYDYFVQNWTYSPNCYIYEGTTETATGSLQMFATPPNNEWVPVNDQRAQSGNATAFDEALLVSLTMEYEDFGDYVHLWDKFDTIFERVSGLITYKDAFEGFMQHMVTQMLADGVQNIEIKTEPLLALYDLAGNTYDFDYVVKFMYGLINATQQLEPHFTLKMIMSDSRHDNSTYLFPLLKLSLEYRNKYPDMVMGFDLVGPEDEGYPLIYFLEDFLEIANLSKSYEYDLPYYFHAGETLDANNTNLFDAILLGCYRIGHAFQLAKHPLLTSLVKANNIGLEICPISNQILMYIHDLRGHPAYNYFDEGLLITISPDDPAIYGYGGVSYDWYEVLLGWSLDIAGLKQLAINSYIKGSFATEPERADCMAAWATKWDAWIEWVIATYPDYALPRHH